MDDLIGELWRRSPLFVTREHFAKSLEGCTFDPVYKDGDMVAVFVVKGPEFHFQVFTPTQATKAHLARYPGSLIEKFGYATTRTPKEDARQLKFNKRLGFYPVGEDQFDIHLRIDCMRNPKEKHKCQ